MSFQLVNDLYIILFYLLLYLLQVIQLYETMLVRHGVMLVGPTGGGKTTVYTILADTLETLYQSEHKDSSPFYQPVKKFVLNPKSVTMGELYGEVLHTVNRNRLCILIRA